MQIVLSIVRFPYLIFVNWKDIVGEWQNASVEKAQTRAHTHTYDRVVAV